MIKQIQISALVAAGGSGAATKTAYSDQKANGRIVAVYLDYQDSPPGTTDVTLAPKNFPGTPILYKADYATDAWFYPVVQAVKNTDATTFTGIAKEIAVNDYLALTIAQANNGDGVIATVLYER
jgi:hypothetical protein